MQMETTVAATAQQCEAHTSFEGRVQEQSSTSSSFIATTKSTHCSVGGTFHALYTKHKTQKRKIWQDGRLVIRSHAAVTLHSANPPPGSGDPVVDTCSLNPVEIQAVCQGKLTNLETEKFLVQVEGPWRGPSGGSLTSSSGDTGGVKAEPSVPMKKLMQRKFRKPTAKRPPPSLQQQQQLAFLHQRKRPLQPGELVQQYYGNPTPPQAPPYPNPPQQQYSNNNTVGGFRKQEPFQAPPPMPSSFHQSRQPQSSNQPQGYGRVSTFENHPSNFQQQPFAHQSQVPAVGDQGTLCRTAFNSRPYNPDSNNQPQHHAAAVLDHHATTPPAQSRHFTQQQVQRGTTAANPGQPTFTGDSKVPFNSSIERNHECNVSAPRSKFVSNSFNPQGFYGEDDEEEEEEEDCEVDGGPGEEKSFGDFGLPRNGPCNFPGSNAQIPGNTSLPSDENPRTLSVEHAQTHSHNESSESTKIGGTLTTDDLLDLFSSQPSSQQNNLDETRNGERAPEGQSQAVLQEDEDEFALPPPSDSSDEED